MSIWATKYVETLRTVFAYGHPVVSRAGLCKEVGPVTVFALPTGWERLEGRGGSPTFARLEQLCYVAGREPRVLGEVLPAYRELCEWQGEYPEAYGPRMKRGLFDCVRELARRPESRRAVALIWQPSDVYHAVREPGRPVPCTVGVQFYVRDQHLEVHAMMRSCDVWLGLYYDLPAFGFLGRCVGMALGYPLGAVYLTATSLHLYERDWVGVSAVRPSTNLLVAPHREIAEDLPTYDGVVPVRDVPSRWREIVDSCEGMIMAWEDQHPAQRMMLNPAGVRS